MVRLLNHGRAFPFDKVMLNGSLSNGGNWDTTSHLACVERVAYPLDAALGLDEERIESTWLLSSTAREIEVRGRRQSTAFGRTDALCRSAVRAARTRTHLDENERLSVARHQIDLAEAAAPVALYDFQALSVEEVGGTRLRVLPEPIQWRTMIGTGRPSAY